MTATAVIDRELGNRKLPIGLFLLLVVARLAVIKSVGLLVEDEADVVDGRLLTSDQVFWSLVRSTRRSIDLRAPADHGPRILAPVLP